MCCSPGFIVVYMFVNDWVYYDSSANVVLADYDKKWENSLAILPVSMG